MMAEQDTNNLPLRIRQYGLVEYGKIFDEMRHFTDTRDADSIDEIWTLQHYPVYTLGKNSKPEHLLKKTAVPVVQVDRGGQVTYHGPGQIVIYLLLDLQRRNLGIKALVSHIEQVVIDLLADYQLQAIRQAGAPGVYVGEAKIAALGIRVRKGRCYHGLSFNVAMDLSPFQDINPCGYAGLRVVNLADLLSDQQAPTLQTVNSQLINHLCRILGYNPLTD